MTFDPNQPRNEEGEWTNTGGGGDDEFAPNKLDRTYRIGRKDKDGKRLIPGGEKWKHRGGTYDGNRYVGDLWQTKFKSVHGHNKYRILLLDDGVVTHQTEELHATLFEAAGRQQISATKSVSNFAVRRLPGGLRST